MAKRRKIPVSQPAPPVVTTSADRAPIRTREPELLAATAGILCVAITWLSRSALNPDGVSYLDLAAALQRGDWSRFAQGYWSPLFPFVTGIVGAISGTHGAPLVAVTHWLNLAAALGAITVLYRWTRAEVRERGAPGLIFGRAAMAAFLICSAGLPRIEAVTPDVFLLALTVWLGYELLAHRGRRWLITGLLLGASFLAKTSAWPWLLLAIPLRLWAAPDADARRTVWRSTLACGAVMLLWIVPMSVAAGRPTVGSAGRLNFSWYIAANSSRLPDGDQGENSAYRTIPVAGGTPITVATFDDGDHWTYQPWGDPTAWEAKVLTQTGRLPLPLELTTYWMRLTIRIFGLWLLPLILGVIVPVAVLQQTRGSSTTARRGDRDGPMVMTLGVVGLLQFAAIHAEPRLIAPSAMLLALGAIQWTSGTGGGAFALSGRWPRLALSYVGMLAALVFAVTKIVEGLQSNSRLAATTAQLDGLKRGLQPGRAGVARIVVIGPAAPVLSAAYWTGAHIVAQIPPSSVGRLDSLPPMERASLLVSLFRGQAGAIWESSADGGMKMFLLPPP